MQMRQGNQAIINSKVDSQTLALCPSSPRAPAAVAEVLTTPQASEVSLRKTAQGRKLRG